MQLQDATSTHALHTGRAASQPFSTPCLQAYVRLFSRAADLIRSRPGAITGEASSNTFTSANGVYLRGFRGDQPFEAWAGPHGNRNLLRKYNSGMAAR